MYSILFENNVTIINKVKKMKKMLPICIRTCIIIMSILFYILTRYMREFASINYDLKTGYIVNSATIFIIAILFTISIKLFKISGRIANIVMITVIVISFIASYVLTPYIGVTYFTIFLCVAYVTEIILNKITQK